MESLSPLRDDVPASPIKPADSPYTKGRKRKRANLLRRLQVVEKPYPAEEVDSSKTSVTRVVAKWKFEARSSKELSLVPGDVVVVTVQDDVSTGWWQGTLKGKDGMFPINYVDVCEVLLPKRIKVDQRKVSRNIRTLQKQISSGKVLEELIKLESEQTKPSTPLKDAPTSALVECSPAGRKRRRNVSLKIASGMGYNSPQVARRRARSFKSPAGESMGTIRRDGQRTPSRLASQEEPLTAPGAPDFAEADAEAKKEHAARDAPHSSADKEASSSDGQVASGSGGDSSEPASTRSASSIADRRAARKRRLQLLREEAAAEEARKAESGCGSEDEGSGSCSDTETESESESSSDDSTGSDDSDCGSSESDEESSSENESESESGHASE
mmetsp:Transcript_19399/g.74487  ORF Transcript_19399/g.74487 Transcript_19399/m.74487 type:complete len:386 (-) Transcript_19399:47-1204(-)